MEKITKFFYYYTLLVVTGLTIGSVFFLNSPFNILYTLVLLPTLFYFWLRITDPVHATETEWSLRIIIVVVLLAGLIMTMLLLQKNNQKEITEPQNQNENTASISAEVQQLKNELEILRNQEKDTTASESASVDTKINDILNSLGTPTPVSSPSYTSSKIVGNVRVTNVTPVNIYEDTSTSSKITGIAEPKDEFKFTESFGDWYLIQLEDERMGWIQAKEVVEFK